MHKCTLKILLSHKLSDQRVREKRVLIVRLDAECVSGLMLVFWGHSESVFGQLESSDS